MEIKSLKKREIVYNLEDNLLNLKEKSTEIEGK